MTAPMLPGERPTFRTLAPAPLLTAVLAGLAVAGAVSVAPHSQRLAVACAAGAGALLLCAAVAAAAHAYQTARVTRRRLEAVTLDAGRLLQERARLSTELDRERVQLTEELTHERSRLTAELTQERARLTSEFSQERMRLTTSFAEERSRLTEESTLERARLTAENKQLAERARRDSHERAAALSATANAAGRMQALATGMLADLRAMEERHSDEDVLADLLHLDHRTAQAGRLADSVAVLTGARSGRRWARPIAMESILRGAMGRISGYQRVRVHSASDAAVAGHAAEGVMHALAELLDNAANFSPPTAEVHVYVEEVPAGVIVSVEDSGLVMGDIQLRRAERAVSGDSAELGGLTGTRLGLAVVGRLARKYGLKVSYRPSARGGTGVLMLVPQDILVPQDAPADPQGVLALPEPSAALPTAAPAPVPAPTPEPGREPEPLVPGQLRVSYASARAGSDLDPDPVPTHESPDRDELSDALSEVLAESRPEVSEGLPKRRRGQALAEAERSRARAEAAAPLLPRPAPTADDTLARAARFNSFRQAVRGAMIEQLPPVPEFGATAEQATAVPEFGTTAEQATPVTESGANAEQLASVREFGGTAAEQRASVPEFDTMTEQPASVPESEPERSEPAPSLTRPHPEGNPTS
ncbi:ATP-binding protein [Streptomyces sp. MBT62]|uniref:ATP-binding protein n=1 Tax=Streptomyces sp. MBT62 TaxID=2800410 RepID=UPI001909F0B4|nr:ATP-binding protein [Streptomyces sp. MBT62]MBK3568434.1 sensor histidine kinase [Streptomyces sp. MBT62]